LFNILNSNHAVFSLADHEYYLAVADWPVGRRGILSARFSRFDRLAANFAWSAGFKFPARTANS